MSVLRFLVTRQVLAALSRPASINLLQNRAQVALASTLASSSTNSCLKAATSICDGNPCQMQIRGHKRFGHQQEKTPQVTKYFHGLILSLFIISVLDWGKVKRLLMPKVDADSGQRPSSAAGVNGEDSSDDSESDDSDEDESSGGLHLHEGKKIREKVGFRERKIIEYENRIRQFSTPDKVFRYFATIQVPVADDRHEVYMTPTDFLTSMTPGMKQPDGLGLDQYRRYDPKGVNSALITYFFGPNMDEKLTIEKFLDFQEQLQREILSLEFERKEPNDDGNITEADFAELLLAYAGYPLKKKQKKLKRVKRRFRDHGTGISKQDYLDFFHFLNNINDVDTALTFYHIAGASIDQQTLQHVAKTVALVNLSDHVVDVVFTIFDENNDNQLSNKEFISVMKNRVQRGLEKPKDTGFLKMMRSVFKCAKETKPVLLDI
ncbi:calcium uptake protein 1 homolog, mitochondrial isoform X5 [Drosophila miranda]|uniref:calcium uptake protein 1 homolog, mitochondrial isoform X5 n=1 Tax=Drosophila miranda TaxID=7229 RepID=UPI00143F55D6|nr:calcium uptake protein 1 homolog, mitochondrial isoform X5 [Drosophila miranda]